MTGLSRRGVLAGAAGGAVATAILPASAAIPSEAFDPVVEAARKLRPLCEEFNRLDAEDVKRYQTLPDHLKAGWLPELPREMGWHFAAVRYSRDRVEATEQAVAGLKNVLALHYDRKRAEEDRGMPELDRRMDVLSDRKDEVEREIVNSQATSLAGAVAQLTLVFDRAEDFTGADNEVYRQHGAEIRRLLFSALAVVEPAANVRREDMMGDGYMPERLNPFAGDTSAAGGTGAA